MTVQDIEGVAHTVEVTAESLYEAIAQGLAALGGQEWVAGITHGTVKVSVADMIQRQKSSVDIGYANHASVNCVVLRGNAY